MVAYPDVLIAVKDEKLDAQHLEVLRTLDAIARAHAERRPRRFVENLLFRLVDLTVIHFCAEEVLMKQTIYPGYGQHSHLHAAILDYTIRVVCDYHRGIISLTDEIVTNLRQSFFIHLDTQDRQLRDFLAARAEIQH